MSFIAQPIFSLFEAFSHRAHSSEVRLTAISCYFRVCLYPLLESNGVARVLESKANDIRRMEERVTEKKVWESINEECVRIYEKVTTERSLNCNWSVVYAL